MIYNDHVMAVTESLEVSKKHNHVIFFICEVNYTFINTNVNIIIEEDT